MKTSKRKTNQLGLKVTFVPATDTLPNRLRIKQTNNGKSLIIDANTGFEVIDFIESVLNKIDSVRAFNLVVDNTQNSYYLFSVDFVGNSFENILSNFKKY